MRRKFLGFGLFLTMCVSLFSQEPPLTLEQCIQIALENNATILTNQNLNRSADSDVTQSYSGVLPNASVSARVSRFEVGPVEDIIDFPVGFDSTTGLPKYESRKYIQEGFTRNSNSLSLNVFQNIFDGGEWWQAISYAKSQKRASDLNLQSVIENTVFTVQERFFDLLKQQKLLEVNELAVKRSQDQLEKTEKMYELGAVAKVDVFRSRVNLGNDRTQLLLQRNAVITAKNSLNLALGRSPENAVNIKPEFYLQSAIDNPEELVKTALTNNPALLEAEEQINSSDINVSRSYAVLYPNLSAFFNYQRQNEDINLVYSKYDQNWNISYGLTMSVNLFNGFRDMVNIQKSKLTERNSMVNYEQTKRELSATVMQLVDNYNSYLEIIEINKENLEAAKEEFRLAEERYRIGSGTQLEVREAQVNLTRAEQTLVAAQYNARITQSQLEQSLGNILESYEEN